MSIVLQRTARSGGRYMCSRLNRYKSIWIISAALAVLFRSYQDGGRPSPCGGRGSGCGPGWGGGFGLRAESPGGQRSRSLIFEEPLVTRVRELGHTLEWWKSRISSHRRYGTKYVSSPPPNLLPLLTWLCNTIINPNCLVYKTLLYSWLGFFNLF